MYRASGCRRGPLDLRNPWTARGGTIYYQVRIRQPVAELSQLWWSEAYGPNYTMFFGKSSWDSPDTTHFFLLCTAAARNGIFKVRRKSPVLPRTALWGEEVVLPFSLRCFPQTQMLPAWNYLHYIGTAHAVFWALHFRIYANSHQPLCKYIKSSVQNWTSGDLNMLFLNPVHQKP